MLLRLEVKNLAAIREAALELAPGLNVLTGETGAGKSLLVDALALLLGERAEGLIGPYGDSLLVTAFFQGEGERVLSRRVGARSTPRIDGEVVSLRELQEEAERWLSLHAQHAALSLLSPKRQREILDALLSPGYLQAYREAYARHQALLQEKEALEEALRAKGEREDLLRFQLREIREARPRPGEDRELEEEARRLRHLETLRERAGRAYALLTEEGLSPWESAVRELRQGGRYDPTLEALAKDLEAALEGAEAVVRELEGYLEGLEADPGRLAQLEERLALLERLKRKYGPTLEEVLAHGERAEAELAALEGGEERLLEVRKDLLKAEEALLQRGTELSQARQGAAKKLARAMEEELAALGLPQARFQVVLTPLPEPGPFGLEEVAFRFAAHPRLPLSPLSAASGGELSRIALSLALLTGAEAPTVVFDEMDTGVGGETAWKLAERLARLGEKRQVLVVTHLPQVAARAHRHLKVVKEEGEVRVEVLEGEGRVRELARLLSGQYTEAALSHARLLLEAP
ncbi:MULTISPECIES: DNA repair protein RecN [Thermus]|jgi:DNA repair protein RecN (Recombination protein N)|uniref:DNA repair protein RecN n=1 Tax=Thermus brockianus TaxID=56956 RepID=A0A1J0LU33_THEBO|nr:DNA repair protein RecN [Thermus brockianus]APD09626.1 DNA repair protein RecN [Thermus brockianus]BDG17094.1 DNA repair protein RecN [Thermus brockianus]